MIEEYDNTTHSKSKLLSIVADDGGPTFFTGRRYTRYDACEVVTASAPEEDTESSGNLKFLDGDLFQKPFPATLDFFFGSDGGVAAAIKSRWRCHVGIYWPPHVPIPQHKLTKGMSHQNTIITLLCEPNAFQGAHSHTSAWARVTYQSPTPSFLAPPTTTILSLSYSLEGGRDNTTTSWRLFIPRKTCYWNLTIPLSHRPTSPSSWCPTWSRPPQPPRAAAAAAVIAIATRFLRVSGHRRRSLRPRAVLALSSIAIGPRCRRHRRCRARGW